MNYSILKYILGYVLKIEATFMLLPCVTSLIYHEKEGRYFFLVACVCMLLGVLMTYRKPKNTVFSCHLLKLDHSESFWCDPFLDQRRDSPMGKCTF